MLKKLNVSEVIQVIDNPIVSPLMCRPQPRFCLAKATSVMVELPTPGLHLCNQAQNYKGSRNCHLCRLTNSRMPEQKNHRIATDRRKGDIHTDIKSMRRSRTKRKGFDRSCSITCLHNKQTSFHTEKNAILKTGQAKHRYYKHHYYKHRYYKHRYRYSWLCIAIILLFITNHRCCNAHGLAPHTRPSPL